MAERIDNDRAPFAELQARIAGQVICRDEAGYEKERRAQVWNDLLPERRPEAIVRVASDRDVQEAVKFARDRGLKVAVRGSGHNMNGAPLRQGGLLLDLSALNEVTIDAASRTAAVQPVVTNLELTRRLAEHGLAFPVGHCQTVSLSGYLLGGGFGWNAGEWGVACFHVTAMDIVTAEGELVRADESRNQELFWAARGAGSGFFGVVTRYYLRLFPLPKAMETSTLIFPLSKAREVVTWIRDIVPGLPANVETTLLYAPAPPPLAAVSERVCIVMGTVFAADRDEAARALEPFGACPVGDCLARVLNEYTPYEALFAGMDRAFPHGSRYAVDSMWLQGDAVDMLDRVSAEYAKSPSPHSIQLSLVLPPPPDRPLPDTAFSMVAPVLSISYAVWNDEARDRENIAWMRGMTTSMAAETVGHYIGEVDLTAAPDRAERCFAKPNWKRLKELRAKHDPGGLFYSYLEED